MKRVLTYFLVFIVGAVVGIGIEIQYSFTLNKTRAVETAERYLRQEYNQEMQFKDVDWFLDPGIFYVSFSPSNDPEIVFQVLVHGGLRVDEPTEATRADNYYIAWFEHNLENYFDEEVKRLWGDSAEVLVTVNNPAEVCFWIDKEINDTLPLPDVAALFGDYHICVRAENVLEDAETMFNFVQFVKQNDFLSTSVIFVRTTDEQRVELTDLNELVSVKQIQDAIRVHTQ